MEKKYFKLVILIIIIGFGLLLSITQQAQAANEQVSVIELKNGNKIIGNVTGEAPNATIVYNLEKKEEEIVHANTISNTRKPTADELKSFSAKIKDHEIELKKTKKLVNVEQTRRDLDQRVEQPNREELRHELTEEKGEQNKESSGLEQPNREGRHYEIEGAKGEQNKEGGHLEQPNRVERRQELRGGKRAERRHEIVRERREERHQELKREKREVRHHEVARERREEQHHESARAKGREQHHESAGVKHKR